MNKRASKVRQENQQAWLPGCQGTCMMEHQPHTATLYNHQHFNQHGDMIEVSSSLGLAAYLTLERKDATQKQSRQEGWSSQTMR
jgi:hypothetical protein